MLPLVLLRVLVVEGVDVVVIPAVQFAAPVRRRRCSRHRRRRRLWSLQRRAHGAHGCCCAQSAATHQKAAGKPTQARCKQCHVGVRATTAW